MTGTIGRRADDALTATYAVFVLTIAVLGAVEVRRDGSPVAVPAGKSTEVLVRLALDASTPVRAETIIEDLWGDEAFGTAKNTLQSKISQLRRALGDSASITSTPAGYVLHVGPGAVDAQRVAAIAATVSALRSSNDDTAAVAAATEGLALFRGDVLAGEGQWLRPHRTRLEEIRMGLLEANLAGRVAIGAGAEVIAELESIVDAYPLRETLWHTLILALYRAGRQADALAAYGRARATLVDELGLEPGPELQALERRILEHDAQLRALRPAPVALAIGNLPRRTSELIGRAADLEAVARNVADNRLVTIVGPAGVGKTRLAVEAARDVTMPGGTWLVRLDSADPTSSIAQVVADTLMVASDSQLESRFGVDTLVVLDNCEHVVDSVAVLAGRLLDATPGLRVLATSQIPLGCDGEIVHPLTPLALDESVSLFAHRAAAIRTRFALDDATRSVVEEVCRSLDGLPLAIELAAARVKSLSVRDIARRLDDRFLLLADPSGRGPERRRTLAAAIGWSYELLFPDDQRGLWALATFAGGARLEAVEHVLAALDVPAPTAVDVIGRLVDRSLVSADTDADGEIRYRLLDSIRAFALGKLRAANLLDVAGAAHAQWFAVAADRISATVRGTEQPRRVAFVRDERANVDAALAWTAVHDPATGFRIAHGFGWAWVVLGDGTVGAARVRGALTAAAGLVPDRDRSTGLLLSGWLEASAGDVALAETELVEALGIADRLDETRLRADAHRHLIFLRLMQGAPLDALQHASDSLGVYRDEGLAWEVAASLLLGASASMMLGDIDDATLRADEAVEILTPIGDSWGLVHAEAMLGAIAQAAHRYADAARYLTHAAAASDELGFAGQAAYHLTKLGRVHHQSGDIAAAADTLRRAIDAAVGCGDMRMAATARLNLARVHHADGDVAAALGLLRRIDEWYRSAGGGDGALLTRALLVAWGESVPTTAQLDELLAEARAGSDHDVETILLDARTRIGER